jgi:predicted dehydrogenase
VTAVVRTAVVGCGLIGRRRAREAASAARSRCVVVVDTVENAARDVAEATGAEATDDWRIAVARSDVDAVVVATPNGLLCEIAESALRQGKHVLVEKPMGRNVVEAERMRAAARSAGCLLKVGFNHRYHPAIAEAQRVCQRGEIGPIINLRCRYGHGARPGYEREWRGSRELAGGGELTDQGVHVADLVHWFAGVPETAFAYLQTAAWPLGDLEDNAFGLFRYGSGVVASFHTSWTQWKNLFSFEVFGRDGALVVEGLGRSYGPESLTVHRRRPEGGPPVTEKALYGGEDSSWKLEWDEFLGAVLEGRDMLGGADDGVIAMRMLRALYESAATRTPVPV